MEKATPGGATRQMKVQASIEQTLKESDKGKGTTHEEILREMIKPFTPCS